MTKEKVFLFVYSEGREAGSLVFFPQQGGQAEKGKSWDALGECVPLFLVFSWVFLY